MELREVKSGIESGQDQGDGNLHIAMIALALVTLVAFLHPHPLVLPLLSAILIGASAVMAGATWFMGRRQAVKPVADAYFVPGLLVFFSFAAAILSDPDEVVKALGMIV
jgi:hypothetical protein